MVGNHLRGKAFGRLIRPLSRELPRLDFEHVANCGFLYEIGRYGRGNTAIGAFSPRARPNFSVASPVTWSQVEQGIAPDAFTMSSPFRPTKHAAD